MCGNLIQNELEKLKGAKILDKKITIKSTSQKAVLAFLNKNNFYTVLKDKLNWGISEAQG